MALIPPTEPDPRTAADDDEDATDREGISNTDPAEGGDDEPGTQDGSPQG